MTRAGTRARNSLEITMMGQTEDRAHARLLDIGTLGYTGGAVEFFGGLKNLHGEM